MSSVRFRSSVGRQRVRLVFPGPRARGRRLFAALLLLIGLGQGPLTNALHAERNEIIYAFRNFKTEPPTRMILVGEIQSKTKVATVETIESPFPGYDIREDQVTVKVQNRRGLKVGQKLYVIDKDPFHSQYRNGLVVGEIHVASILYNPFYGWVVTGTGILLRVREGQFVARTLDTENLERAYSLKKRGDHYANRGNFEKAISSYNEALVADSTLPEANAAMGDMFFGMALDSGRELPVRALSEYDRAWQNRVNFRYDYEKFHSYKKFMDALYYTYRLRRLEATRAPAAIHEESVDRRFGNDRAGIRADIHNAAPGTHDAQAFHDGIKLHEAFKLMFDDIDATALAVRIVSVDASTQHQFALV